MSKNFKLTLPGKANFKGDVIVTDPCYFIPDNIWDELCSEWFTDRKSNDFTNEGVIEFTNGAKVLYSHTAYGDGRYPVSVSYGSGNLVHKKETGVDAGMIAVVTVDDIKKIETDYGLHRDKEFDANDNFYPRVNGFHGTVEADGKGNFVGDIEVDTLGQDEDDPWEEDDDYENDDDEEKDLGF